MKRRGRLVAVLALLFGPAACGRSCGCVEGEKAYESLDGKVKVELVRKVHWTGGKIPGPMTDFYIRVHTTPAIDHLILDVGCDHVDMAEDDAGKNVAWRCKGTTVWSVLRLRGGDRYVNECKAVSVGTEKKPAFDALEPLSVAADRIVGCAVPYGQAQYVVAMWKNLLAAIEEDEGAEGAARTLIRLAARPIETGDDTWNATFLTRSDDVRARVLRAVCPALERPDSDMPIYARAATYCSLDGPGVAAAAVAQLERLLKMPVSIPQPLSGSDAGAATAQLAVSHRFALEWAAVIAVKKAPVAAGAAACATAPGTPEGTSEYGSNGVAPRRVAAAVIAATKTKCDAARAWLEPPPCGEEVDCDGGLCTEKEVSHELDEWAAQGALSLDAGARASVPALLPKERRALLGLAYAQGPLDRETTVRNARRHYAQADGGGIVRCEDEDAGNGTPCVCTDYGLPFTLCSMPSSKTREEKGACSFHIDDAKRRIDDVKRVCSGEGGSCSFGRVCCAPYHCRFDEASKESRCKDLTKDAGPVDAAPK